jgi:dTDP-4-dehydrorhamnose reductase
MRWRIRSLPTLLVTGATGFLGRHVAEAAADGWQLVMPPSAVLDVRDRASVLDQVTGWRPDAVVHLAYRRDDRRTTVDGSRHVAEAAAACGARLVHLSTDLVFGGRPRPYTEGDVPDPIVEYGELKARAEREVATAHPAAVLLRTSLLYGTDLVAPCQLDVDRALDDPSSITFFTDEERCPAHAADVAAGVLGLLTMPDVRGPLHLAGPEPVTRAEFAAAVARWLGGDPASLRTGSLASAPARRPGRVVLDSSRAAGLGLRCRSVGEWLRPRSS